MLKINPSVVHRFIDGKIYIADPVNSVLYELNETAAFIWQLITKKKYANNPSLVIPAIVNEYDISTETAIKDTIRVIKYLIRKKILILSSSHVSRIDLYFLSHNIEKKTKS